MSGTSTNKTLKGPTRIIYSQQEQFQPVGEEKKGAQGKDR